MRLVLILLLTSAGIGTAAVAARPQAPSPSASDNLRSALHSMVTPPGQSKRPVDPDQGDDHASVVAIDRVCTKHTPAAHRSAICPTPVSPF